MFVMPANAGIQVRFSSRPKTAGFRLQSILSAVEGPE